MQNPYASRSAAEKEGDGLKTKIDRKLLFSPFVLQLLFIMFAVEFVKGALLLTFLPLYLAGALQASAVVIGWTLSAQYIGDNALRTPIGWLIDRYGYRACMLLGLLASSASVLVIAFTTSYIWIVVACALLGVGTSPLWPCVITGTTEIAGDRSRGTIMSVVYIAWLAGTGLGPVAITYFLGGGYSPAFRLLIGLTAAALLVALFLPGRPRGATAAVHEKPAHRMGGNSPVLPRSVRIRRYFSEVRRSMNVGPLLFPAMFAQTFALGLLTPVLTLYATRVLQLTGGQYRLFLIAGGLVTVLFMMPVGKWVDRFGTRPFLIAGFFLSSAVLIAFPFTRSMQALYMLVGLLGLGYALIIPSWNALIAAAIPPAKRGAVWGFFLTIEGAGTTIGPIVSGVLWARIGPHAPFVASGAVLFLILAAQFFIRVGTKRAAA